MSYDDPDTWQTKACHACGVLFDAEEIAGGVCGDCARAGSAAPTGGGMMDTRLLRDRLLRLPRTKAIADQTRDDVVLDRMELALLVGERKAAAAALGRMEAVLAAAEPEDPAESPYVCRQCECRGGCSAYCGAQDMEIRPVAADDPR